MNSGKLPNHDAALSMLCIRSLTLKSVRANSSLLAQILFLKVSKRGPKFLFFLLANKTKETWGSSSFLFSSCPPYLRILVSMHFDGASGGAYGSTVVLCGCSIIKIHI